MRDSHLAAESAPRQRVGALVSRLQARLREAGLDAPDLDAQLILATVLRRDRAYIHAHPEKIVSDQMCARAEALTRRRISREPMAYILGEKEFWSMPFLVSPDVLIPRPDSELLVARAAALLRKRREPRILDVGAGTGAVGLAIGRELPEARITLLDVSLRVLRMAKRNTERFGLGGRTTFLASDLLQAVAEGEKFDLIASNPPYVESKEVDCLMPEVSWFEPRIALDGGVDGMNCIRRIIAEAPLRLAGGGFLLLEMAPEKMAEAIDLSEKRGNYSSAKRFQDIAGRDRVLELRRG